MQLATVGKQNGAKRGRRPLLWVALTLVAALVVASYSGWLGFGWALLKSRTFPRDDALLGFVPDSASAVLVVDPHLLEPAALGPASSSVRQQMEHGRSEVKKATGIDVLYDVDKIALAPGLLVARGRFDEAKIADKLAAYRYARADYKGTRYLVRAGEDALAIVEDVLLYGDEAALRAVVDARADGTTLEKDDRLTERLNRISWKNAAIFSVRLADDKPSLRSLVQGANGPRAVTGALAATKSGIDVRVLVDAATPEAAQELAKTLEQKRQAALAPEGAGDDPVRSVVTAEPRLADVVKMATLRVEGSAVRIGGHLDANALDAVMKVAIERASTLEPLLKR